MPFWPDLSVRYTGAEIMDSPGFSGHEMSRVLRHLKKVNSLLGNHRNTLSALLSLLPKDGREIHIVDIGCGGGDLICYLNRQLKKRGYQVHFTGIDFNSNILKHASETVCSDNNIRFVTADVLAPQFEVPECDVLISSHFIYRFTDEELSRFLSRAGKRVKIGMLFSELRRSRVSYVLFNTFGKIFFNSPVTIADGLVAIRRSFRVAEMRHILRNFGQRAVVSRKPIFRQVVLVRSVG